MGKIRVKSFGDEDKNKKKKNQEKKTVKVPGLKGEEKVVAVGPATEEEELERTTALKPQIKETEKSAKQSKYKEKKQKAKKEKITSKRHLENYSAINGENHSVSEAVKILQSLKKASFDETVELHLNVKEKGISGQISLPHGSGKKLVIEVADAANPASLDKLISEIEKGKINFDILIATPNTMAKLAKLARILGPRGLMPNPKAGTITEKPNELIEKLSKGQLNYRTESEFPLIHLSVGKISFTGKQLEENVLTALLAIGTTRIIKATLKSTMSPGIKLNIMNLI